MEFRCGALQEAERDANKSLDLTGDQPEPLQSRGVLAVLALDWLEDEVSLMEAYAALRANAEVAFCSVIPNIDAWLALSRPARPPGDPRVEVERCNRLALVGEVELPPRLRRQLSDGMSTILEG